MLHPCKACGKEVSNDSEACPHCGQVIFPESARGCCGCLGAGAGMMILSWVAPNAGFGWYVAAFVVGIMVAIYGGLWLTGLRPRS